MYLFGLNAFFNKTIRILKKLDKYIKIKLETLVALMNYFISFLVN